MKWKLVAGIVALGALAGCSASPSLAATCATVNDIAGGLSASTSSTQATLDPESLVGVLEQGARDLEPYAETFPKLHQAFAEGAEHWVGNDSNVKAAIHKDLGAGIDEFVRKCAEHL